MKKIFVLLLLTITTISFAQSAGKSGLSFLKNGFGARNIAMSDFGIVKNNDVTALNYNPALLAGNETSQLAFTHMQLLQDAATELLGAKFNFIGLPFAVGINTTSIDGLELRTKPGEALSKFDVNYFYGSISTGFFLTENISFGTTVKYLYEGYLTDEATGFGFDFGVSYKNIYDNLDVSASLRNVGTMDELRTEKTELPKDLRLGAGYDMEVRGIKSIVTVIGGFQKYLDTDDSHLHLGGEVYYDNLLAVRLGYVTGYEARGLSTGFGIKWGNVNFDYAYSPMDYNLGDSHVISIMYSFL